MSDAINTVSDLSADEPAQSLDHGSATSAMIVGSVFVVIVGAVVLIGDAFKRYPVLMTILTLASALAAVLVFT